MDDIDNLIREIDEEFPELSQSLAEMRLESLWCAKYHRALFWCKVLGFAALALLVACLGLMRSVAR